MLASIIKHQPKWEKTVFQKFSMKQILYIVETTNKGNNLGKKIPPNTL